MSARLVSLVAVLLLGAGCKDATCRRDTIHVSYAVDAALDEGTDLTVTIAIDGENPQSKPTTRQRGDRAVVLEFAEYPTGSSLTITLTIARGSEVLGTVSGTVAAQPGCTITALDFTKPSDGGVADGSSADLEADLTTTAPDLACPVAAAGLGVIGCACTTAGELVCNGNAQKVALICASGVWALNRTCDPGENCDSRVGTNQGTCAPIDPLCTAATPGQLVCSDATTVATCGVDLLGHDDTAMCTAQACVDGVCIGECAPGTLDCDASQPIVCNAMGAWQDNGSACTAQVCHNGVCEGACAEGQKGCSNQQPQVCNASGAWVNNGAACTNQACVGGDCQGVCTPSATRCETQQPQRCSTAGAWANNGTACSNQTCCSGSCQGVCAPGQKTCSGNSVQTCTGCGVWSSPVACSNQACVSGACQGVCAPGATRCCSTSGGVKTCSTGHVELCVGCGNGQSVTTETCNASGQWATGTVCGDTSFAQPYCSISGTPGPPIYGCDMCGGVAKCLKDNGSLMCVCP